MILFYDVSRLIARTSEITPTGIDRVDIKYLNYLYNSKNIVVHAIFLHKGIFHLCDEKYAEKLVKSLYNRWILGSNSTELPKREEIYHLYENRKQEKKYRFVDYNLFVALSASKNKQAIYLNVSHHGIGQIDAYYIFKTLGGLKIMFYLHDLIPIDYPEYVREGDEVTHQKRIDVMANFADAILVNSEYTENCFIKNCQKYNYVIPPVKVLHIGVEQSFLDIQEESLGDNYSFLNSEDYFIYVGTIEPRKNHLMLLNLWRQYFSATDNAPKLVLLGKRGWNNEAVFNLLDRCPALHDSVIELHGVSDGVMVSLIKNAKGVLFPTFVEGWGMPLVEAMSMKVPVLAADIPALREAGQNLAEYIDPMDALGWRDAIIKLQNEPEFRDYCIKNSAALKLPSWEKTFKELDQFLFDQVSLSDNKSYSSGYVLNFKKKLADRQLKKKTMHRFDTALQVISVEENAEVKDSKIIHFIFKRMSDKNKRKLKKLMNNPKQFFLDSKSPLIKSIGKYLEKL